MRIPIRNKGNRVLTVFVELQCVQFEVPVGGEAIVRLESGLPHSIDIEDGFVTVWDEGGSATVEVVSRCDKRIDDALMLIRVWLHKLGAKSDALLIEDIVERFEISDGYFYSRDHAFRAFHDGFVNESVSQSGSGNNFGGCYLAGVNAARLNLAARRARSFPELGGGPFDTDLMRSAFDRALANGS